MMINNLIPKNSEEVNEFIFEQDKYFNECHAATIIELPDGNFVASWFAGTKECNPDVAIWLAVRDAESQTWSEPKIVADIEDLTHWNPVLFYANGVISLFYRTGYTIPEWQSWLIKSVDGGNSFSAPEPLPDGFLGPIKNKPILLSNGDWLCPSSRETKEEWFCVMETFSPRSNSWTQSAPIKAKELPRGLIQPTVWESEPGNIHAFMRSTDGRIYRADSSDYGKNWTSPSPTQLLNPDSGIDCCRLDDGRVAIIYNPVPFDVEKGLNSRTPLVLAISSDNGKSWEDEKILESDEGEFSYPAIIATQNGIVAAYTWKRKRISFRVIPC